MSPSPTDFLKAQTDYLIFIGVSVVVFVLVSIALRVWRGARLPLPAWVLAGAILVGGWWSVQFAGENARKDIERLVSALAPTYSHEMARTGHEKITLELRRTIRFTSDKSKP